EGGGEEGEAKAVGGGWGEWDGFDRRGRVGRGPPLRIDRPIIRNALSRRGGQTDFAHGGCAQRHVRFPWKLAGGGQRDGNGIVADPGFGAARCWPQRPRVPKHAAPPPLPAPH